MTSRSIPSSPPTSPPRRASRSRTATQRNFELVIDLPPSPSRKRSPSTSPLSKNHHTAKKLRRGRDEDASLSTGKENIDPVAVEEDSTRVGEMDLDIDSIKLAKASLPTPRTTPTKKRPSSSISAPSLLSPALPPRVISNIFAHAHSVLSTASTLHADLPLLGRDAERKILLDFLSARFDDLYPERVRDQDSDENRPSIYISGPPGLGKTALLSDILHDLTRRINAGPTPDPLKTPKKKKVGKVRMSERGVRVHMENCSSIGTVGMEIGLWERLGRGLGIWDGVKRGGKAEFEDALTQNKGVRYLIILDEIDHILSATTPTKNSKQTLLNQLFTLVHSGKYSITLVGIANALDLTVRSLHLSNLSAVDPKGKGKALGEGPILLHFEPYKPADIVAIVKQRLSLLSIVDHYPHTLSHDIPTVSSDTAASTSKLIPLIQPAALEFCAKKVAAATGDIRTALAIIQYAINMVESAEVAKQSKSDSSPTTPSSAKTSPIKSSTHLSTLTATTAPKVTFSHILAALKVSNLSTKVVSLETKLGELAFNARMVLVGIVISLYRSRHALSISPTAKSNAKKGIVGIAGKEEVRLVDAYEIYKEILKKEGTLKPVSREEFRTTLDGSLEGNGFLSISFAATRSAGVTMSGGKGSKKILGGDSSNPLISLGEGLALADVGKALRLVPSTSDAPSSFSSILTPAIEGETKISGVLEETLRISICLLDREERRLEGVKRMRMIDGEVPMEGFHGDGLGSGRWIGEKRRRVEDHD